MGKLDVESAEFWEGRYRQGQTAWETGGPAPSLEAWLREHPSPRGKALVLGCGKGHDAVALAAAGFEVTAIDFAPSAIEAACARAARGGLSIRFIEADLFALGSEFDRSMDLVFEHTFLSALRPDRRKEYARLVARIIKPGGLLIGIFFTGHDPDEPPFGITPKKLSPLLKRDFQTVSLLPVAPHLQGPLGGEHLGQFRRRH